MEFRKIWYDNPGAMADIEKLMIEKIYLTSASTKSKIIFYDTDANSYKNVDAYSSEKLYLDWTSYIDAHEKLDVYSSANSDSDKDSDSSVIYLDSDSNSNVIHLGPYSGKDANKDEDSDSDVIHLGPYADSISKHTNSDIYYMRSYINDDDYKYELYNYNHCDYSNKFFVLAEYIYIDHSEHIFADETNLRNMYRFVKLDNGEIIKIRKSWK